MDKNIFFVGIDSGGTKCELLINDGNNRTIQKKTYKSIHYSLHGKDKLAGHLKEIIKKSLKEKNLKLNYCKGICIGLAGAREKKDKINLEKQLKKSIGFNNIIIESDTVLALQGAFNGNSGLILICGTGSILYGNVNGKFLRIGGWGRRISDYGSGYEIGRNAIKHLVTEYDKSKISKFSKAIEKEFSFNKTNILENIYHKNFDFQHLVPFVLKQAEQNNKDALKIINKAVEDLSHHFELFFAVSGLRKKINLAFSGSIIENENVLSAKLKTKLKRNFKYINIINKLHSPSEGAILLAKNKFYIN